MQKWKVTRSEIVIKTPWFSLRKDRCLTPQGIIVPEYYTWQKRDCVIVFPITKDNTVLLIKQYRHGVREICLDFPGGTIEEGQSVEEAASAELLEETGYAAQSYEHLGEFLMDSSYSNQKVRFVIAKDCVERVKAVNPQEITEIIKVHHSKILDFVEHNVRCLLCSFLAQRAYTYLKSEGGLA